MKYLVKYQGIEVKFNTIVAAAKWICANTNQYVTQADVVAFIQNKVQVNGLSVHQLADELDIKIQNQMKRYMDIYDAVRARIAEGGDDARVMLQDVIRLEVGPLNEKEFKYATNIFAERGL